MSRWSSLKRLSTEQETDEDKNSPVRTKRDHVVQTRKDTTTEQDKVNNPVQKRVTDFSTKRFVNRVTDVHGRTVDLSLIHI